MNKESVMTKERIEELEKELEELKIVRRKDVAEKIKVARSYGDLSENSEYDEAMNEQAFLESRISQLEKMLTDVKVLDHDDITTDVVGIYSVVTVKDLDSGSKEKFTIVGSTEADYLEGKISDESPVGRSLLGKKKGDKVDITVPSGAVIHYQITAIAIPDFVK